MAKRKLLAANAVPKCLSCAMPKCLSCYLLLVVALGTLGCHSWHMLRAMAPGDSDTLLAWEPDEPLGSDLATQEWTDDFSAQTRPARKSTRSPSTSSTASTASTERVPPAATATEFTIGDLDEQDPPHDVSDELDRERTTDELEPSIALLSAEVSDAPATEPGETVTTSHALAGSFEPMMEPDEIGVPLDDAAETGVPPTPPESTVDTGFFRNIFIDVGVSEKSRPQGTAKAYSGIRRLFHHPDVKTRYRSHSRFSRQFQSQPREE